MQKSKSKKCKHSKKINLENNIYCVCNSKKGRNFKYNRKYEDIVMRSNMCVMGSQVRIDEYDNWWELCVKGKDTLTGKTPSKCAYF